jgi:hypothetical protein
MKKRELNLDLEPVAGAFAKAIAEGTGRELACFGARGDGKTFAALIGMIMHAQRHHQAGYPLPVRWIGVADTFRSHEIKTCRSLMKPEWQGGWSLFDHSHLAVFRQGMTDLVHLDLFGIEDQGAMDRVRMETVGVWFEEPAPAAVLVQSSGITDAAWSIALTSQGDSRIKSHAYPACITSNLPDEDHWTWKRFSPGPTTQGRHPDHPDRLWFRIPPGERASAEDRAQWAKALEDRPDLLARLLEGKPGTIILGGQVAVGFDERRHVSAEHLSIIRGEPIGIGLDFGHTPTAIIGQDQRGTVRIYASLTLEKGGIRQLLQEAVRPWLGKFAPWALRDSSMIIGGFDPAGETEDESDIENSPMSIVEKELPGDWEPGPIAWETRRNCLLTAIGRYQGLIIDPACENLIRALSGRWYYPTAHQGGVRSDKPKKPNHPHEDLGDALIYLLARLGASPWDSGQGRQYKVENNLDALRDEEEPTYRVGLPEFHRGPASNRNY